MHIYILNFKLLVTIKFNHLLIEWIHTDGLTDVLFPLVCERLDYKQIKKTMKIELRKECIHRILKSFE